MNTLVEHVIAAQNTLGEGPLWHPLEQALYWLDIYPGRLHRFDPRTQEHSVDDLGVVTGSMGLRERGGFVLATRQGFAFWQPADQQMEFLTNPDAHISAARFNDGKTDPQGRFWAGKMSEAAENSLFRLDPDGSVSRMETGVTISNGLGWSPDLHTFYFTDSPALVIYAYDYDPASGALANRRELIHVPEGEGVPDGLAVDAEGCIWSARWGGWKIVRYDPQGQKMLEVALPVELVTSCAFGGPGLDELYITSAAIDVRDRAAQPLAGDVFRIHPGVRGLPEPFFKG